MGQSLGCSFGNRNSMRGAMKLKDQAVSMRHLAVESGPSLVTKQNDLS
jgi:hypothetical protein